jgi:hypothetical protein
LQTIADLPNAEAILYEELPYLWGGRGDRTARRAAAAVGLCVDPFELSIDPVAKARRLRAYSSQIPQLTWRGRRLDDPASLPSRERYWRLRKRTVGRVAWRYDPRHRGGSGRSSRGRCR